MASDTEQDNDPPPADLSHAGAVVDKAIEYMTSQNIGSVAVASALLGGALGMLVRSLDDESVVRVLERAIDSVRSGEMRQGEPPNGRA